MIFKIIVYIGRPIHGLLTGNPEAEVEFKSYLQDNLGGISVKEILESDDLIFQSAVNGKIADNSVVVIEFSDEEAPQKIPEGIEELLNMQFGQLTAGINADGQILELKAPKSMVGSRKSLVFNGDEFELNDV